MNTPYHTALIMAVSQIQIVSDADRFMPEPKLGNLKDPDKIEQKKREHEARWRESLVGDPLLSVPLSVGWIAISQDGVRQAGDTSVLSFIKTCDKTFSVCPPQAILGPHPTTHMRLVQNAILRGEVGIEATDIFTRVLSPAVVPRVNIWRDVCPDSRGDCGEVRRVLDLPGDASSDVDATLEMAKILGYLD